MTKKLTIVTLSLVLAFSFALSVSAEKPKLTVWYVSTFVPEMKNFSRAALDEFAEMKGIDIEIQYIADTDAPQKYAAAIEGGNPPDLAEFGTPGIVKYAGMGQLEDMGDLFAELSDAHGGVFDIGKQAVSYQGTVWGIPVGFQAQLEHWRIDVLKEAGLSVPETWNDLFEVAKKVNKPEEEFYGIGQPLSVCNDTRQWFRGILWGFGGKIVDADSQTIALNSPETLAAIQYVKDTYDAGLYPPGAVGWDGGGNNKAYLTGRALYVENAMSVYAAMKKDDPELLANTQIGTALAGPKERAIFGGVFSYSIFKQAQNKDLAKEFVKFFYQKARFSKFLEACAGYYTPVFKEFTDVAIFQDPYLKPLMAQVEFSHAAGYPGEPTPQAQEVFDRHILIDMLQRVIVDNWDPQKAVDEATDRIKEIYNK